VRVEEDCLFCGIVAGSTPAQIVYANETVVAFRDVAPQAPTHVLIVPREHIVNASELEEADAGIVGAMLLAAREVADLEGIGAADRGYRLIFNVGPDAQNSVPHLHLHLVGGRAMTWPPG
jgi:histidine triad (HIT) family protein